jgi:acetate kinase
METDHNQLLVLNAGSSSLKFSIFGGEEVVCKGVRSLAAALGGLDALVFTAGIGEHAAPVRARVCELSRWLGIRIDPDANTGGRIALHSSDSAVDVLVIPTNEELIIAQHTRRVLAETTG